MRLPFHLGPRSVSARVFWLTVIIIFVVDIIVMMPGMGQEWQGCLKSKVKQAEVAVIVISGQGGDLVNAQSRGALSRLSGTVAITLTGGGKQVAILQEDQPVRLDADVDLDRVSLWQSAWRADREVVGFCAPYLPVDAAFPFGTGMRIDVIIRERPVTARLRNYVAQAVAFSLTVALVTGMLVYAALYRLLVKPMRIMTANIVAFRRDPEYARLSGLKWLGGRGDDEVSRAARELVVMQDELRTALWRNAQLAALGTAVAKISHDLRNILASALLVAERFQENGGPAIRQSAASMIASIERAVELVSRTADSAGGQPPPVARTPVLLRELIDEVVEFIRQSDVRMAIENLVPGSLVLPLDRNQIYRVLVNLLRNAAEAGASRVILSTEDEDGVTQLVVTDNGPGLPRKALTNLFRPFTGSGRDGGTGLGLAIARDLVRAHGGDLLLRKTGPTGTEFVMSLPAMAGGEA